MIVSVFDVSKYILNKSVTMTTMKLQKLVYYCQAWSLVWDEEPLFKEKIEAWANGPIVRDLFNQHRNMFKINSISKGSISKLTKDQRETIDGVLNYYGKKDSQWLSELTHNEDPWRNARTGLSPGERGNKEITHASMMEYYNGLV